MAIIHTPAGRRDTNQVLQVYLRTTVTEFCPGLNCLFLTIDCKLTFISASVDECSDHISESTQTLTSDGQKQVLPSFCFFDNH